MVKEFREFVIRGNMIDMAVGITVGTAFGAAVASLVNDVVMPPVGLLLSGVDFADFFVALKAAGAVTLNYGAFANTLVTFLVVSLAIFAVVRFVNQLRRLKEKEEAEEPSTKKCPYCLSTIPAGATRCAHCTADLG
jgi:large conductance mechanosensitive channel